jgi:hypothetical protein
MPTDLYKDVLFTDGEGADVADLNNLRGFMGARVFDQVLRAAAGNARGGSTSQDPAKRLTVSAAPFLYALSGGTGYIAPSGLLQTTVRGGTIFQQVGSPAGDAASFLPYTMVDGEFTLAHAAGDATHPRVDVIEVKLEYVDGNSESRVIQDPPPSVLQSVLTINKKRRVQATFQINQGTPAASPAYPSLTSGFAALGAVLVPAGHTGLWTPATHLRDLRIPIGVKHVDVLPSEFLLEDTSAWTIATSASTDARRMARASKGSSGAESLWVPCPLGDHQRIVGLELFGQFDGTFTAKLYRTLLQFSSATVESFPHTEIADVTSRLGFDTVWNRIFIPMDSIEADLAAGPSPARNAQGLGDPLWGNGLYCGPAFERFSADFPFGAGNGGMHRLHLDLNVACGVGETFALYWARWHYAEGL